MQGTYRTLRTHDRLLHGKTNFNDWSDPKLKHVRRTDGKRPTEKHSKPRVEGCYCKEEEPQSLRESECSRTSQDIADLRSKIKNGYTLLSQREIRSYRLPFYESLLINLKDDGFLGTSQYISDIVDLDVKWHEVNGVAYGKTKTYLRSRTDILTLLCDGLVKAEVAKREGNRSTEIRTLLDLAVTLSNDNVTRKVDEDPHCWMWLAEELYEQCIHVADSDLAETAGQKLGAIAKHLFAAFLLETRNDPRRARHFVEASLQQSMGRSWTTEEVIGKKGDTLYIESCLLLQKIFIVIAQQQAKSDVAESIKLCRSALYWAKQVNSRPAERAALKQLVMTYISAGQLAAVPDHLARYMRLCKELEDVPGICDGHIMYAAYHDLDDEQESVIKNIQQLLELATQHNIPDMMALAHHKMVTFYLKRGRVSDMEEHASKAYSLYVTLDRTWEMEETKCLTGIVLAQGVMKDYINILLQAETLSTPELNIMILWKNLRIPFFSNVTLLQPESDINVQLKDRVEFLKNEEMLMLNKKKQLEIMKNMPSRFTLKPLESYVSVSSTVSSGRAQTNLMHSPSVIYFRTQLVTAGAGSGGTS